MPIVTQPAPLLADTASVTLATLPPSAGMESNTHTGILEVKAFGLAGQQSMDN